MKKFELPIMEIKVFANESIVTESSIETTDAMIAWQESKENAVVRKLDYVTDLVGFTF